MTYVNYGSLTAVGILFPVLSILTWSLRVRIWIKYSRRTTIDDILVIPAVILVVASGVALVYGAQSHQVGGHLHSTGAFVPGAVTLPQQHVELFENAIFLANVISTGFARLTILFFFRRTFSIPSIKSWFDVSNWSIITVNILWMIAMAVGQIFYCGIHVSDQWTSAAPSNGHCVDTFAAFCANAVISWMLDLAMLIEPLAVVARLKLKLSRRLDVGLIFLLAILAVAAGLAKMIVILTAMSLNLNKPLPKTQFGLPLSDLVGIISIVSFWTYLEMGICCLVACLVPCRRYLNKLHFGMFGSKPWTIVSNSRGATGLEDPAFSPSDSQRPQVSTSQRSTLWSRTEPPEQKGVQIESENAEKPGDDHADILHAGD